MLVLGKWSAIRPVINIFSIFIRGFWFCCWHVLLMERRHHCFQKEVT